MFLTCIKKIKIFPSDKIKNNSLITEDNINHHNELNYYNEINNENNSIEYILRFNGITKYKNNNCNSVASAIIYQNGNFIISDYKYINIKEDLIEAEYYGLILGLELAINMKINKLKVESSNNFLVEHMEDNFTVQEKNIMKLYKKAKKLENNFDLIIYDIIRKSDNLKTYELCYKNINNK